LTSATSGQACYAEYESGSLMKSSFDTGDPLPLISEEFSGA